MNPVIRALLTSWQPRPLLILLFLALGTLYTVGWWRLRTRSGTNKLATGWRLLFYWLGLIALTLSLMSPLDLLAEQLFYMHMIQHLLMTMVAAPLLLLANPMAFVLWGLPQRARRQVGRVLSYALHRKSRFRTALRAATTPGICWMIMVALLWGWHDPNLYNGALRHAFVHDLEHIAFFGSAALYWWHATGAAPRIHRLMPRVVRVGYLLAGVPVTMAPGIVISFSSKVLYTYYETVPRLPAPLGISAIDDQILGGIIMWVPGSMMFIIGALVVIARWLQDEEEKKVLHPADWGGDDTMLAPGIKSK